MLDYLNDHFTNRELNSKGKIKCNYQNLKTIFRDRR
jgi:hypothetical protein